MARRCLSQSESRRRFVSRGCPSVIIALFLFSVCFAGLVKAESAYKLYVTHPQFLQNGKSAVSIINLNFRTRVSALYPNPSTDKILYSGHSNALYLFSSIAKICEVYDPVVDHKLLQFNTGGAIADAIISKDGRQIYIANGAAAEQAQSNLNVYDAVTGANLYSFAVGQSPCALELSPDGSLLYVADRMAGIISVVELKNYQTLRSFYAGVAPTDVELSWDGRSLIVGSANLEKGNPLGAGVAIIDLARGAVSAIIYTAGDIRKVLVTDSARIICLEDQKGQGVLDIFSLGRDGEGTTLSKESQIPLNGSVSDICLDADRKSVLAAFNETGVVAVFDLASSQEVFRLTDFCHEKLSNLTLVPIDFAVQLARRDSLLALDPQADAAQEAFFEKAYLYRCMGDKNSEVKTYNDLAEKYRGTKMEVLSLLRLGDLCFNDQLYANSADFYARAFKAYATFLERTNGNDLIEDNLLFSAVEKLGEFSVANKKDYLKDIEGSLEVLSLSSYQLAELDFLLGYYLKKQGNTKLSQRALDESERQLIQIMDAELYKKLKDKFDLLRSEGRAVLKVGKLARGSLIDGDLSEWNDQPALFLDRRTDVLVNASHWADTSDLSVEFKAAYDQGNLYLGGKVSDNILFSQDDTKEDRLVIYIDTRENSGDYLYREKNIGPGVIKLEILPPFKASQDFKFNHPAEINPVFGAKLVPGGYTFELRIPFAYLGGFKPESKAKLGLGLEVWDADSNLPRDPLKIMGWLKPTESIEGDRDCRLFGILEF